MRPMRCERGATLVEFSVCAAVLFLCVFGIFGFCSVMYSYNFVNDAAREASRYAIVRGSQCKGLSDCGITSAQIQTYVQNLGYPGINTNNLTATASWSGSNTPTNAPGNTVSVTVSYSYGLRLPFWTTAGTTFNLSSTSNMVVTQ